MEKPHARTTHLLRSGAQVFVTKAAPALAALAVLIGYSRALPEADYGRYTAVWARLGILGTLAYAGVPLLLLSLSAGRVKHWAQKLRARHILLGLAWLLAFAAVFAWIQWKKDGVTPILSALLVVLYAGASVLESALIVGGRQAAMGWGGVAYALCYAGIHWLCLEQGYSLNSLLFYLVVLQSARLIWYGWMTYAAYARVQSETLPNPARARRYWLHTGLYDLSINVARWADKTAVSFLLAAAVSAVYFNGSLEVPFIPLVMGAAGSVILVELAKGAWPATDAARLVRDISRVQSAIVFPVFFFLFFFRAEIFAAVFGEKYAASVPVFAASLLVLPLRSYHFTVLLESRQEGRTINTGAALDIILTLTLLYPLYKIFGLPGVALSPVVSTWVQMGYYLIKTAQLYEVGVKEVFPLMHWLRYGALFGGLLCVTWAIGTSSLDAGPRLLLGAAVAAISGSATLFHEIRRYKKLYGQDYTPGLSGQC